METKTKAINLNRPGYIIFLAAGILFLIRHDLTQASIFWALAMVFDPFNVKQPYAQRPFYQKAWMFVHLAIALAIFIWMIRTK